MNFKYPVNNQDHVFPFMAVQEPPSTKKCLKFNELQDRHLCFTNHVNDYLECKLGKRLNKFTDLTTKQCLHIMFKICANGEIEDIQVHFKNNDVVHSIIQVMKKFPPVIPARDRGKAAKTQFVTVYSF